MPVRALNKIGEGSPHVVDWIERGDVDLVINTPMGTARAPTAMRSAAPRWPAASPASPRCRAGWRPPGRSPRRAPAAARGPLAPGDPAPSGPRRCRAHDRPGTVRPPSGQVVAAERSAPTACSRCTDPDGPVPEPGQFYMLAAAERWGEGGRAAVPPARLLVAAPARDGQLEFLLEDVGPGTRRLMELRAGDGLWLLGPLGRGFEPPGDGARLCWWAAGSESCPWRSGRPSSRPAPALLGFRDAAHAEGAALLDDAAGGHRRRLASAITDSSPSCSRSGST